MGEFFVILGHFLPFDPPSNLKIEHFEKLKKKSGDIIILQIVPQVTSYDVCFLR